jgi:hypothetical protein
VDRGIRAARGNIQHEASAGRRRLRLYVVDRRDRGQRLRTGYGHFRRAAGHDCGPVIHRQDYADELRQCLSCVSLRLWTAIVDPGAGYQIGLPIEVRGTAVPQPHTDTLIFLAGITFALYTLRRGLR